MLKISFVLIILFSLLSNISAQQTTYCNPMNLDYGYTPIPGFSDEGRHRATADPVIVNYKNEYYLFSTNQWGYWHSSDLMNWKFISRKFLRPWNVGTYDELCAPAVGVIGDTMIVIGSTYTKNFTLWMSTNPAANEWKPLIDSFEIGGWDPAFFTDPASNRLYMYNGSSNRYPLYGIELNRKTFKPIGTRQEMYVLESWRYGWQRFGEYQDDIFLDAFTEGATCNYYDGKYYFQYGAPGTEFSHYADGVLVGETPLGPWTPQPMPFSYKPGGFARGAGHGSTFQDAYGNWWHTSTIMLSVKNNFERRIGLWPAGFDKDGVMYCNQAFGDYPHKMPAPSISPNGGGNPQDRSGRLYDTTEQNLNNYGSKASPVGGGLVGAWMLLNYKKPIVVSSTLGNYNANNVNDEDIKTYWSAATANSGEYVQSDLGNTSTVNAIQINYADQDAASTTLGKQGPEFYHQYKLYASADGKKWNIIVDKSNNKTDVPHDYIELSNPVQARYIKLENIHMPTGKFAISGLRIFGNGNGVKPEPVKKFVVLRTEKDKRSAWIKWQWSDDAYAYNIYMGTAPDKLYNCIMVHSANEYFLKTMDKLSIYYFRIEAINENGVSTGSNILKVE